VKTVFFDVDTQLDFLYPGGALYVPGSEDIVKALTELTLFAASSGIQIVSDTDAHTEDDPEFKIWKPHCVAGTVGQQKAAGTLLNKTVVFTCAPCDIEQRRAEIETTPQLIVEKQSLNCFSNPSLHPLLDVLKADRYVVYGVVTEICVRFAAFGLLETGARVELVTDAIRSLNEKEACEMIQRFEALGGQLTTVAKVTR
jgi:nicotinamidase/pyrazinamidase